MLMTDYTPGSPAMLARAARRAAEQKAQADRLAARKAKATKPKPAAAIEINGPLCNIASVPVVRGEVELPVEHVPATRSATGWIW